MFSSRLRHSKPLLLGNPLAFNTMKPFAMFSSSAQTPKSERPRAFMKITRDGEDIGTLVFELYAKDCPKTVENFMALCSGVNKQKLTYKGSPFHRIVAGFMAQGGDITQGGGGGGMSIYGERFPDENLNLIFDGRGILAMANRGPNTNNSQFFITFAETRWLNGVHTIFGELVEGNDTLSLLHLGGSTGGEPTQYFYVDECGVMPRAPAKL